MRLLYSFFLLSLCSFACEIPALSLEEKVGQVLMVHFHGEEANDEAREISQELKIGGIIYYNWANGLHSCAQIAALSRGLQALSKIPLLLAVDQEGGIVTRLPSSFPGNRALGETGCPRLAREVAFAMGRELRAAGIQMNLAPVVDIYSNPQNPFIGQRSFGETPEKVVTYAREALEGFREAGVIATLKHFPGYGDVAVDPHAELPVSRKSLEALEQMELRPFAELAPLAEAIMTAHILVPAFDADHCATLSQKTLCYLREEIGFSGVIVADSLVMEGVLKKCHSVEEAAIQALNAGCDLLILGGKLLIGEQAGFELTLPDLRRIHAALVAAVESGRIAETRLNDAVRRLLALKERHLFSPEVCLFAQSNSSGLSHAISNPRSPVTTAAGRHDFDIDVLS